MSSEPQKKYLLKSEDLCVQIAAAGVQYIRSRFDKSGNVQQVTLRGRQGQAHTFLGSDTRPPHESCGGFGLMNEFMPSDQKTYDNLLFHFPFILVRNLVFFAPNFRNLPQSILTIVLPFFP